MVEVFDTCVLNSDNKRRGGGPCGTTIDGVHESWIIGTHNDADGQDSSNVENHKTVNEAAGSLRKIFPWGLSF
ncbi:hypothetical protein KL905_005436 [Ogataea polymorpha]|nr:hypothetical protein KL937_005433 [Ogataea polymorpha]KAG7914057.1 hypothetical protein KL905_005436 [Ogataea polymorpha]KAG7930680.1 hypothetical protein KL904_005433 [Ogataea polymorpha]